MMRKSIDGGVPMKEPKERILFINQSLSDWPIGTATGATKQFLGNTINYVVSATAYV